MKTDVPLLTINNMESKIEEYYKEYHNVKYNWKPDLDSEYEWKYGIGLDNKSLLIVTTYPKVYDITEDGENYLFNIKMMSTSPLHTEEEVRTLNGKINRYPYDPYDEGYYMVSVMGAVGEDYITETKLWKLNKFTNRTLFMDTIHRMGLRLLQQMMDIKGMIDIQLRIKQQATDKQNSVGHP